MSTTFRATGYALCLSTLLLCATHAHASVSTSTGKINFNGKVTAPVPSIVVRSNGADTELSAGTTIDLGTVSADTLDGGAFPVEGRKNFSIVLKRANATDGYNHVAAAKVSFSAPVENGVIKNTASSGARNVGVDVMFLGTGSDMSQTTDLFTDTNGTAEIPGAGLDGMQQFAYEKTDPSFNFAAAMRQITPEVAMTAGDVNASMTVIVTYN